MEKIIVSCRSGILHCRCWRKTKVRINDENGHTHTVTDAGPCSACTAGFPLDKAVSYAKLRNPLLINDLNMQYYIQDRSAEGNTEARSGKYKWFLWIHSRLFFFSVLNRREVYRILQEEGIDLPRYAVLNRDPDKPDGEPSGSIFIQKKETQL